MTEENRARVSVSVFEFLERTATQGERSVALIRLGIAFAVTLQFLFLRRGLQGLAEGSIKHVLILAAILGLCLFSTAVLVLLDEESVSHRLRVASVAVDALATFLVLVPSTIWAKASYQGFLTRPDPAIYIIVIVVAGFRLSSWGVRVGATLSLVGAGAIVTLDHRLNRSILEYGPDSVVVYGLLLVAAVGIARALHRKIVELVRQGAEAVIEGERASQRFGVYLSSELVDEALAADELRPGGHKSVVSVLFSDLRGFTTYSEQLPPERLVHELNEYLEAMVNEIKDEGGVVDKYIGDAIMVVFGIPSARGDEAERAIRCAARMDAALRRHNALRAERGLARCITASACTTARWWRGTWVRRSGWSTP